MLTIKSYSVYDKNEITIGCIALGERNGGCCVWLRGGIPSPYTIISTVEPKLYATGWSESSGQVATIGPTYHGAETGNQNMSIWFSPLDIPSGSAKNFDYTTYGTFEKAIKDSGGNVIKDTYATKTELNNKQDKLSFDSTPTSGSTNPVTSEGIYNALSKSVSVSVEPSDGTEAWIEVPVESLIVGSTEPTDQNSIWMEVKE